MTTIPNYERYFELISQRSALIDFKRDIDIPLPDVERPIKWCHLFANENPVEIEIGCGKGRFLLEAAKRNPQINYVGVERAWKYANRTKERLVKHMRHMAKQGGADNAPTFSNVLLIWSDAAYFVDRYILENSVKAYHVYFSDPWPKERNKKRRLFRNYVWLDGLVRTLQPNGGRLYLATDHAEYFYEIHDILPQSSPLAYVHLDPADVEDIPTNFELKYTRQGRKIYRAVYELRDSLHQPLIP